MELNYLKDLQDYFIFFGIVILLIIVYFISSGVIRRSRMTNDGKRKLINHFRTAIFIFFISSFFTIWAQELYQVIIPIAAFVAAFIIANKELFLCISGSFYRAFARPCVIGDRVEFLGIRGDVVDFGLLSTQLLEVGPGTDTHQYTGRTITVPNSEFLTKKIFNYTESAHHDDEYMLHVFKVPVTNDKKWREHYEALLEAATESSKEYIGKANRHFKKISEKKHVDIPAVKPRINVQVLSPDVLNLVVRITIPAPPDGSREQKIIKSYLDKMN